MPSWRISSRGCRLPQSVPVRELRSGPPADVEIRCAITITCGRLSGWPALSGPAFPIRCRDGCRFIEDENRGVFEDRARDGETLALAPDSFTLGRRLCFVALAGIDEVVREAAFAAPVRRRVDVLQSVGDVAGNSVVEQEGLLATRLMCERGVERQS